MPSGLIIAGTAVLVPGLEITNYVDDPGLRLGRGDMRPRTQEEQRWIKTVILHTTRGIPGGSDRREQVIRPGLGPAADRALGLVRFWRGDAKCAGAHLIVNFDGRIACCADLAREATFHAGHANASSIGVEIVQGGEAELYEGQLEAVVKLCDALTKIFLIQRQIPHQYIGPVRRLMEDMSDVVGVLGHRDLTNKRGKGDPGNAVFNRLGRADYESVDYDTRLDLELWRRRQRELGIKADGIPGPATARRIREAVAIRGVEGRRPSGLWVLRPGDETDISP
jgi:hypothetical protein